MNTPDTAPLKNFAEPRKVDNLEAGKLLTIGPVARLCRRSTQRIRQLAAELGIPDTRAGIYRVFDQNAVARLKAEVERREKEAVR